MTSLSAAERRNPPPRQKACAACTRSKRRCDAALPSCARCTLRGIPCAYPSRRNGAPAPPNQASRINKSSPAAEMQWTLPTYSAAHELDFDSHTFPTGGFISDVGFNYGSLPSPLHSLSTPRLTPVTTCEDSTSSLDSAFTELGDETALAQCSFEQLAPNTLAALHFTQPSTQLTPPRVRTAEATAKIIDTHLKYAIETYKKAPQSMVETLQTPWSHHCLYRDHMPRSIRDAHAACSLYMAKTAINAPVIMRSIDSYCQDLLASPQAITDSDILAHAHALLLYQIIRLFDGDILAHKAAERDLSALESAAVLLLSRVRFEQPLYQRVDLPLSPLGKTKAFWKEWLFQESARRTMLFIFFFLQTYRIFSGSVLIPCDGKLWCVHSLTLSAHLWRAKTPVEFATAWRDRNHFVVTNAVFKTLIEEARADDVDSFGRMLLTAMMGQDETDAWLTERGGSLREEVCV